MREPRARQYQGLVKTYSINHIHHFGRICQLSLSLSLSVSDFSTDGRDSVYAGSRQLRDFGNPRLLDREDLRRNLVQGNPRASRLLGPMGSKSSTGYIQTTVRTDPARARQRQGLEFSRLLSTSGDTVCPLISADLVRGNARASRLFSSALMCSKSSTGYIQTTVRTDPARARQRQGLEVSRLLSTSGDPVCPLISVDLVRGNARASRFLDF